MPMTMTGMWKISRSLHNRSPQDVITKIGTTGMYHNSPSQYQAQLRLDRTTTSHLAATSQHV